MQKMLPLLPFCAMLLTGCVRPEAPQVMLQRIEIPESLLTCQPDPEPPLASMQGQVAIYLLDLWSAGESCREKLSRVRDLVR